MPKAKPKITVKVTQTAEATYRTEATLPGNDVTAESAADMAFHASRYLNQMLRFAESKYRIVFYDTETKKMVVAKEKV